MISVRSNHISLKYQRFTPSGCKDIWIRKFKFVAKTSVLLNQLLYSSLVELQKYKWWCEKDGKDTKITELQLPKKIRKNESSKITLFVSYCMHKTIHRSYQEGVFSPHVPSSFGALTYRNIEISNRDILLTLLFNNHVSSIYNLYLQRRLHPPPFQLYPI